MKWSISSAALEFGCDRKTLTKGLLSTGAKVEKGGKFTTKEICAALFGDYERERAEAERLDNELRRINLAKAKGEAIEMAEVNALYNSALVPVRQMILSMPSEICSQCNPTDPQHARAAAQAWVDNRALPGIREKLPQPKVHLDK